MNNSQGIEPVKRDIIRLCHRSLDSHALRFELLAQLQRVIPFDYAYFSITDPATQLALNTVLVEEPPPWLMSVFLENEFLRADFNKFSSMLTHGQSITILSDTTEQVLERSARYRDMLRPLAMGDELRAVFADDTDCWGTLCLHRSRAVSSYSADEAALLLQVAPHITEGLRKGLLLERVPRFAAPDTSGVLVLSEDLSIAAMTAAAEYWLDELKAMAAALQARLPLVVRSVVARLKAIEHGMTDAPTPKARVRTPSGHWLLVYASRLKSSETQGQIAVIFEVAQPSEMVPLIMQVYRLTKRESEVTQCVLRGWSTQQIASALHISANTVQDHLKAIFDKVDVNSRGALAARLFMQQHQP